MTQQDQRTALSAAAAGLSRRRFLGYAGGLAGIGLLATAQGCKTNPVPDGTVNLGSGDVGILNYAYALEQLEAAFYTRVIDQQYSGMSISERALLTDIRQHEIAHREFFRNALGGNVIQDLGIDLSSIDFADRNAVLSTARTFEDVGVSAYNGAGKLIVSPDYLTLAGKIVSVEARHAAYIRELLAPGSFADTSIVDATNRADVSRSPAEVMALVKMYFTDTLDASGLPTS
jgi:hypothetical protein